MSNALHKLTLWLATGFGLGFSPVASGTAGSLPGVLAAWLLARVPWWVAAVAAAAMTLLAIPICDAAERHYGKKDDGRIVADEYLTFPICVIGLPILEHPWLLAVAFVVNRGLDIVKPAPARQAQELKGGLGIVTDDFVSSLYALLAMHVFWYAAARWLNI